MPDELEQTFSAYPSHAPPVRVRLVVTGPDACSYLPGRTSVSRVFWAEGISPQVYDSLMDAGFRRSGKAVYQPVCPGCRSCVPLRVLVTDFRMSKSQRRVWRKNQDLTVAIAAPQLTHEKWELYRRYQEQWHGRHDENMQTLRSFLYDSPVQTMEFAYRDGAGRLLGVALCDVSDRALSSVYFYHEPQESRRSLGTFAALWEIEAAKRLRLSYYYLGYWVDGCSAMQYKAHFRPYQLLGTDGTWRRAQ